MATLTDPTVPAPKSQLRVGETLQPGESLYSPNGRYRLWMQKSARLIFVEDGKKGLWWTDTATIFENKMFLHGDGNLVLIDLTFNQERWSSNTGGKGNANTILTVQDDGAAVLSCDGQTLYTIKSDVSDRLVAPNHLATYQFLRSANGKFEMRVGGHQVSIVEGDNTIWKQHAAGNTLEMEMMDDDDFIVVNLDRHDRSIAWSTSLERPKPSRNAMLLLQDNGVAVVKRPDGKILWSTNPVLEPAIGPDPTDYDPVGDAVTDRLKFGQCLLPGQSLTSANGKFKAIFKESGALAVVYNVTEAEIWTSQAFVDATRLCMTHNSALWLFDSTGSVVWSTPKGWGKYPLVIDNDGHLFIEQRLGGNLKWKNSRRVASGRGCIWSNELWVPAAVDTISSLLPGQSLLVDQSLAAGDYALGFTDAADLWIRDKEGKTKYYYTDSGVTGAQFLIFTFSGVIMTDRSGKVLATITYPEPPENSFKDGDDDSSPKFVVDGNGEPVVTYPGRGIWSSRCQGLGMGIEPTRPARLAGTARSLRQGVSLRSPNERYHLVLQPDGDLVLSDSQAEGKALWASGSKHAHPSRFALQLDGNLVIYGGAVNNVKWMSGSSRDVEDEAVELVVLDEGEAVVRDAERAIIWSTSS